jgi:hypothetical protein
MKIRYMVVGSSPGFPSNLGISDEIWWGPMTSSDYDK